MPYFGIFRLRHLKTIALFEISTLEFVTNAMFLAKKKHCKFEKTIVMFHISVIEFVQAQSFAQKTSNLGPKMPYMGIFNLKLEKTILGV